MQLKSLALLLIAAALVMGQEEQPQRERQRQLAASRRNKLIEEAQSNRATSPVVAPKRRIVSRTRVTTAAPLRASLRTTEAPTTTTTAAPTTTEAATEAVIATETTSFADFSTAFTDAPQEPAREEVQRPEIQSEPQEEVIRGALPSRPGFRPVLRPVVEERPADEPVVFRPRPFRPLEEIEQTVAEEVAEPVQEQVQPIRQRPVEQPRPVRPLAGPTRNRVQPPTRVQQEDEIEFPSRAPALSKPSRPQSSRQPVEVEERPKKTFVETTRRYQFTSPDGSFTFGYENADGSFKEETRGIDCVVHGKYGYVEEDGTRREFTYQTGNPCDPNAVPLEEAPLDDEIVQAPVVRRPSTTPRPAAARPVARPEAPRPAPARPQEAPVAERRPASFPTFQQAQQNKQESSGSVVDEEREIEQVLNTPTRINRPAAPRPQPRPAPQPRPQEQEAPVAPAAPRPRPPQQQPGASVFDQLVVNFDAKPTDIVHLQPAAAQEPQAPAQEEVIRGPLPSRPGFRPVLTPAAAPRPAPSRPERPIFEEEEEVFVQRNERPRQEPTQESVRPTGQRSFATELVFDPRNNQFQAATQQFIPSTQEDFRFRDQLIAFAPTTTPRPGQQQREQPREQPREQQPQREQRPQFPQLNENTQVFQTPSFQEQRPVLPQFQTNIGDQERARQEAEARRQQQEQQRLADERQRIAEENERRRLQPAVVFAPLSQGPAAPLPPRFADQQFPGQFQQPRPQFQQQPQSPRVVPQEARPTFASGQIDSFLSTL